jgi:AcrR family transcriptional regulator
VEELLDLILAPLDRGLADQVRQRFEATRHDPDADELHALSEALRDYPDEYPPNWWLDPARSRWWLGLHVDWKAYDEVAWQVQATAHTLGLETGFESAAAVQWDEYFEDLNGRKNLAARQKIPNSSLVERIRQTWRRVAEGELLRPALKPPSETPTMDVLGETSGWLRAQGYELLYLNSGGDEYLAVPIRQDLLAQAQKLAADLNIPNYLL